MTFLHCRISFYNRISFKTGKSLNKLEQATSHRGDDFPS